jgi:hypothetical protein
VPIHNQSEERFFAALRTTAQVNNKENADPSTPNGREILRREERSFARSGWQRKAKSTATENAVPQRSDDSATRESKERRAKARRYDGRRDHEMTSPIREPD